MKQRPKKRTSKVTGQIITTGSDNEVTITNVLNEKTIGSEIKGVITKKPEVKNSEWDLLGKGLGKEDRTVFEKYELSEFSIPEYATFELGNHQSVRSLKIGIFSSESEDVQLLHYLLKKIESIP